MIVRAATLMLVTFISFTPLVFGQAKKMEREKRVNKEEIPDRILKTLKEFILKAKKVRYYEETDGNHKSFEIKFLLDKNQYSVEFNNNGRLEDVEVIVDFDKLNEAVRKNTLAHLRQFDNFKIKKTQKQFSSGSQSWEQVVEMARQDMPTETVRYEIIVQLKSGRSWTTYEMLFDQTGHFISRKEVVSRSVDHILY